MGKYKETAISREVINSVGGQTFCDWRGEKIVKMKITKNKSKTPAQVDQRTAFVRLVELAGMLGEAAALGFPKRPRKQDPEQALMHASPGVVTVDESGEVMVDYARIVCAKGPLLEPKVTLTAGEDNTLTFTHPAQERGWRRESTDRLYAVLLEKELKEVQVVELNTRSEADPVTVTLEEGWKRENLCVYVFYRAAQGKKVSNSQYVEVKE